MPAKRRATKRKARKTTKRKLVCPKRSGGRKVRAKGGKCWITTKSGKKKTVKKVPRKKPRRRTRR